MSAQDLADACDDLDHPIPRNVIANLESGRRSGLTVADLLVLAEALDVPPLWLLFPLNRTGQVDALPGQETDPWQAFASFVGEIGDERYAGVLALYRRHEKAHTVLMYAEYQHHFGPTADEEPSESGWRSNKHVAKAVEEMRQVRALMRARRLRPPQLSPQFSFVDDDVYTGNSQEETT